MCSVHTPLNTWDAELEGLVSLRPAWLGCIINARIPGLDRDLGEGRDVGHFIFFNIDHS